MKNNISSAFYEQIFSTNVHSWWPGIAGILVDERLNRPVSEKFPSCSDYTTSKFLNAGVASLTSWVDPWPKYGYPLRLEYLSDQATSHDLLRDHSFANMLEFSCPKTTETLSAALSLIGEVPTLASCIEKLVRSAHLLNNPDPAFDVSFSDPHIPFSIFISVPNGSPNAVPRTAEAIIHESMHLQLSLLEQCVPLVHTSLARHYSPWKKHHRPASGIIHALYVFTVIDEWIMSLNKRTSYNDYFEQRRSEIATEISHVDVHNCLTDATDEGRRIINQILERF